jgi:hypothetical protein
LIVPAELAALFQRGPVLLIVDGDDPGHRNLPDGAEGSVLLVPLAGDRDRDRLIGGVDPLEVPYGSGAMDGVAALAVSGYVGIVGRGPNNEPAVALRNDRVARLGAEPAYLVGTILAALQLAPPQAVWSFPSTDEELEALVDRCVPSKPAALALAREGDRPVWLGLRKDTPGIRMLMPPHDGDRHDLLLMPETKDVATGEAGVSWRQATPTAGEQEMFVPWAAIWGMRTIDAADGWLWPADFPASMRADLSARVADIWPAFAELQGVPMPPPPSLKRVLMLAPPTHYGPQEALRWAMRQGAAVLIVDAQAEGVRVPAGLSSQPVVAVAHGLGLQSSMVVADDGVVANLPDADGNQATLHAPWSAVLAVQTLAGFVPASWAFPEHATEALKAQMTVDRFGHRKISLQQPCGALTPAGRPTLQVEFQLPHHEVH